MLLSLYIALIVSGILFLALVFFSYHLKRKENEPFNIRQYFFYEAFQGDKNNVIFLRVLEVTLISINIYASAALFFVDHDETLVSKYYFLIVVGVEALLGVTILFLSLVPLSQEKIHVLLFFLFGALLTIRSASIGRILISAWKRSVDGKGMDLIFAIISFAFAVISFLPLINPKLKNYATLIPTTNKDGTTSMERPHYFVMAFSEWLLLIINEVTLIATFLFSLYIK